MPIRCKLISPTNLLLEHPMLSPVKEEEYVVLGVKEWKEQRFNERLLGAIAGAAIVAMMAMLIIDLFFAATKSHAQSLPDKPQATVTVPVYYKNNPHSVELLTIPVPHRTVDDAYIQWNSGMFMVSAADSALALSHPRYEVNPLMRHHPVPTTIAGFGIDVGVALLDHKWKRQDDAMRAAGIPMDPHGDHRWWALPALVTAIRGAGLISGIATMAYK